MKLYKVNLSKIHLRLIVTDVNAINLIAAIGNQQRQSVTTMAKNLNAKIASSLLFFSLASAGLANFLPDLIILNILQYKMAIKMTAVKLIPIMTKAEYCHPRLNGSLI